MPHPVLRLRRYLEDARYRLGRWLIRPEAERVIAYYRSAAEREARGSYVRTRLTYTAIGAEYVVSGWPERPRQEGLPLEPEQKGQ